jgi:hypothetical protein
MAAAQHNPSRRALLGAAITLPLASSFPRKRAPKTTEGQSICSSGPEGSGTPDQVRGDRKGRDDRHWQRALARFRAVEAEVRDIERATAGGSAEEEEALEAVYMDRLGDHSAALLRLMKVRAPDLAALAVKIELAIDEEVGTLTGGEICLAMLRRDVRRLMR